MEYIISEQMRAWGRAHGWNVDEYVDWFTDYLANRAKKYKDNDAAFRNCVRSDWPGFRKFQKFSQPAPIVRANTFIPLPKDTAVPMPENMRRK